MRNKFLTLTTLVLLTFLSGCAILSSQDPSNGTTGLFNDDKIRALIIASLHDKNPQQANTVAVLCFDSHVFLIGHADEKFQNFATRQSYDTPGVAHVTTHWFPDAPNNNLQDAAIAANIDSAIFLDAELSSTRMAVEVFNGNVILCGIMRNKQNIDKVVEIARRVNKVKSVTSYLTY